MGPITNESEVYTAPYRGYRFALQAGQQPTNSYTEHRKGHAMYAGVTKYGIYIYIYMCSLSSPITFINKSICMLYVKKKK